MDLMEGWSQLVVMTSRRGDRAGADVPCYWFCLCWTPIHQDIRPVSALIFVGQHMSFGMCWKRFLWGMVL
jgi:hypothetical protein